ncbi:DUF2637 domain-containing protein [Streptomyces sp. NPDC093223]|uniref:DUF2637 domain-containing protein n=1 Tax=Streptomyces sp. NPDC093223 TaxID=3366033 RepID=UPI0038002F6B
MDVEKFVQPVSIGFAALCILATVAIVLHSRRSREQDRMSSEERERIAEERRKNWRRRLAVLSLSVAFVIIFCIAGIAAWLSFGAQKAYAFDRNGGSWESATGFALLLDAGALGLSLLRLFEALTARSSQLTRFYLVAFIVASATMNLLHAPSPSLGGRLVAVIPPLVYAVFLETLLKKVEQLVLGKYPKRKLKRNAERGYSLWLWVPFVGYPRQMWKKWRADLLDTMQNVRAPGSLKPLLVSASVPEPPHDEQPRGGAPRAIDGGTEASPAGPSPAHTSVPSPLPAPAHVTALTAPLIPAPAAPADAQRPSTAHPAAATATGASQVMPAQRATKKDQLFGALVEQLRQGDLRVLSDNSQLRNAAAYQANKQLGAAAGQLEGLMTETSVRNTVKQLMTELRRVQGDIERERATAGESVGSARERVEEEGAALVVRPQHTADDAAVNEDRANPREPSFV